MADPTAQQILLTMYVDLSANHVRSILGPNVLFGLPSSFMPGLNKEFAQRLQVQLLLACLQAHSSAQGKGSRGQETNLKA